MAEENQLKRTQGKRASSSEEGGKEEAPKLRKRRRRKAPAAPQEEMPSTASQPSDEPSTKASTRSSNNDSAAKKAIAQRSAKRRVQARPGKQGKPDVGQRYVDSLDGLRALCALAVIGYHMRLSWCGGGLLGVTVLFVLSGYLVTAGLMREFGSSHGRIKLGSFFSRRFWRLMPTVVVFVAVTGAICALFDHVLFTKMRPDIIPGLLMVINWTKIFGHESYFAAAGAPSPLTHFWSLAIEWQFYLIWPPIFYLLMRKRVKRKAVRIGLVVATVASAVAMAMLYVPGEDPTRPYYGTDTRAMSLLLGCWLAIVWPFDRMSRRSVASLKGRAKTLVSVGGPLCVVGIIALMVLTEGYTSFSYYGGILLCSVLSAGAIAALVPQGSVLERVLSLKPLTWVGKRSYAIYLWHYPILEIMNPLNVTTGIPWWKLLLELAIILVAAELSYRLVEVPLRTYANARKTLGEAFPLPGSSAQDGKSRKRGTSRGVRLPQPLSDIPSFVPALAITAVTGAIMAFGLVAVEPVTVAGDHPGEKRVMQASLKKPLKDGVYDVVFIGDSVSLGANEQLNAAFPHGLIDTRGEREMPEAIEVLEEYLADGVVGDQVVLSIGTNGMLEKDQLDAVLSDIGKDRELWLVNLRSPNAKDAENNALLEYVADENDNVHLIDWHDASAGNEGWLIEDGIHLTWDGRDAFAKLVVDTMGYEPPNDTNTVYEVVLMGDSVCLDAAGKLADKFPRGLIDTADGRSPSEALQAFKGYLKQDVVDSTVVLCLGNEEALSSSDVEAFVTAMGADRHLWIVTVRTPAVWGESNNKVFKDVADAHKNVDLIDWYAETADHEEWIGEDGNHLTSKGVDAYASLIVGSVEIPEKTDDEPSKDDKDAQNEDDDYDYDYDYDAYADSYGTDTSSGDSSDDTTSDSDSDSKDADAESDDSYGSHDYADDDYAGYDSDTTYDMTDSDSDTTYDSGTTYDSDTTYDNDGDESTTGGLDYDSDYSYADDAEAA